MKVVSLPVADLLKDPSNVRRHGPRNLDTIKASLAKYGQQKPLVVGEGGVVIAGNGTLEAAAALGWDRVDCVRSPLKGSEATGYSIADNRSAELAEWDDPALAETLRALQSEDFDLDAVGFTDEEVDRLCAGIGDQIAGDVVEDPNGEWQGMPEFEGDDVSGIKCTVHFETVEAQTEFETLVGQKIPTNTHAIWYPKKEWLNMRDTEVVDEP